ncbi:hypothetical protein [Anaerocolumna sp.]|uniref:hypothetical protein n=1 Tax=Anaerocolumna sp. TaxID=2041569 RepID=UPI0028B15848|nr:hypothetical protein [Anaerocolumna sp.]
MRLKYKKMMIMVSMCIMGIGMITFSIVKPSANQDTSADETKSKITSKALLASNESITDNEDEPEANTQAQDAPMVTLEAPEIETAKAELEPLKKDSNKKVNKLIKNYLNVKLKNDMEAFKPLVNDASLLKQDDIKRQTKYIEDYDNITCYTQAGPEEGSYVVYAYHEVKFKSIDTLAPAMNEFYVKTNDNGEPYIYLGVIDSKTDEYLDGVRNSEEVMDLIYDVNDKLQQAVNNDSSLSEFYLKLEETTQKVTKNE